jgi:hypothetical protein
MKKLKLSLIAIVMILATIVPFSFADTQSKKITLEDSSEKNVIEITEAGTYEFTGTSSNAQISVNANKIKGEVRIILNNANITCEDEPAIFIYSKDIENEDCTVVIETAENSVNNVAGGKIKTSVEGLNQDDIEYYIEKGTDDDGQYYERYKYDGAISSDISLTFEGTGTLNVEALKKEGIESKMNITINSGNINVSSLDDGINASADGKSVITINGGTIVVNVKDEAEEGDGIDSNGSICINGGIVYAFAHPGSDNGLDSDDGVTINGGTVLSTGSMYEEVKAGDGVKIAQINLQNAVSSGDTIAVVDSNNDIVFAYKADRQVNAFAYTSEDLKSSEEYSIYTGTVTGETDENGIYTDFSQMSLSDMTKQENSSNERMNFENKDMALNQSHRKGAYMICIGVAVVLLVVMIFVNIKLKGNKLVIANLFAGLIIGAVLCYGVSGLMGVNSKGNFDSSNRGGMKQEFNDGERPSMPDGEKPSDMKGGEKTSSTEENT